MKITVRQVEDVTVLDVEGKVVMHLARELEAAVSDVAGDGVRLIVNLEHVPYMDSSGIGGLVGCTKIAAAAGAEIRLLNPKRRVYDVLQLVKLADVFECHHDESEAIASFRK